MKCCKGTVPLPVAAAIAFSSGILLSRVLPPVALTVLLATLILFAGIAALLRK